jgi:hypothetical protein
MMSALFAANEAERTAPGTTLVDVQMIGAAGRIYTSRSRKHVVTVRDRITSVLKSIEGREH